MTLYTSEKSAKENLELLQKVTKTVFTWAEENAVQFNDSKSKLIYFCKERKEQTAEKTLLNKTVIKSIS